MHELPILFQSAERDSVLWLAVRALAFADLKNETSGDIPFQTKARQHYGAALSRMRSVVYNQQDLSNDEILFSMILIDNFEVPESHITLPGFADESGLHSYCIWLEMTHSAPIVRLSNTFCVTEVMDNFIVPAAFHFGA